MTDTSATSATVVALTSTAAPALPEQFGDALSDFEQAARAAIRVPAGDYDITPVLQATVVCTGPSQLEALQGVVEFVARSPRAEIHSIDWARTSLGEVDGLWEYRARLTLSYPDARGETMGVTHYASGPRS